MNMKPESSTLPVSVVICTDGRAATLDRVLGCLQHQTYPVFEVVVVRGPTEDGISEVLQRWGDRIKVAHNAERNLSVSRNLGIALSTGEVVAFLDDDAFPEADWLARLAAVYDDECVGAAGGFVFNPDGYSLQYRFGTINRMGIADLSWQRAAPELCFPYSANFPHLLGANSSFRRRALLEAGGFDEEYEYFLDETDVTVRLVDAGWKVMQLHGAFVHHKYLPSALRNSERVVTNWYPILKNKLYYSVRYGLDYYSLEQIMENQHDYERGLEGEVRKAIEKGKLDPSIMDGLLEQARNATRDALLRVQDPPRHGDFHLAPPPLLPFETRPGHQPDPRCWCLLSREYPPGNVGGIARYTHELARGLADLGHEIHVITRTDGPDTIDFEDGVWVHRVATRPTDAIDKDISDLPGEIARPATRIRREVEMLARRRRVHAVSGPIWDVEPIALLAGEGMPAVAVSLHTSLKSYIDSNPRGAFDKDWLDNFAPPVVAGERRLLMTADAVIANSNAIVADLSAAHGLSPEDGRLVVQPHGMMDWGELPATPPEALPEGALRMLFVGRLEPRKGIDTLLAIAPEVLAARPNVVLDIVGEDRAPFADGPPIRERFEAEGLAPEVASRIRFHGGVADDVLRGFYAASDLVVTPSRYESFGLMLVEAMMYAKPVIACRAGGMPEVVADGETGLLAEPGDTETLKTCVERLIDDADLRGRMGRAGRARYETHFSARVMAQGVARGLIDAELRHDRRVQERQSA
ncbi:glycosyltransferase [Acidimangrovimonas sediminis]|uniref:glycosyltransferase n=1 Tax=Acidimangrovimonas sediminis TaxID=2056283 RepID=UPI000C8019A9|nr:glycosyltransferase [Acidimangrovimonas sediminis]